MRSAWVVLMLFPVVGTACSREAAPAPASAASVPSSSAVAVSAEHPSAATTAPVQLSSAVPRVPPATAEACRSCRGDWGAHGISDKPSCDCRTNDGGKRCRDGADCQGVCIAGENPETEVVSAGPPSKGYFVGRCSELVTVYGCNRIIDRGVRQRGPALIADPPQAICVD